MKILGGLLIVGGAFLCMTILFIGFGVPMICAGALLVIASAVVRRQKAQEELARDERDYRDGQRLAEIDPEASRRARIANSAFGR
jgi:hypothetical protein